MEHERIENDARLILSAIERGQLPELGFSNVCLSGQNRDEPLRAHLLAGMYPTEPQYRAFSIRDNVDGISKDKIRSNILSFKIPEHYLRSHKALLGEFILADIGSGSLGGAINYDIASLMAEKNGLPIAFFLFSKYVRDGHDATHMYFPTQLMPDDLLERIQKTIKDLE